MDSIKEVLVIGGTGAQGQEVVKGIYPKSASQTMAYNSSTINIWEVLRPSVN